MKLKSFCKKKIKAKDNAIQTKQHPTEWGKILPTEYLIE